MIVIMSSTYAQEESQLGVAIRHVPGLTIGHVHQRHDHVAERRQRLVDVSCFFQTHTFGLCVFLPLRACKVDEIEARDFDALDVAFALFLRNLGGKLSVMYVM